MASLLSARSQLTRVAGAAGPARRWSPVHIATASRRSATVVRASKSIEKISGEQLEVEIANRDRTLIIDFFATWCGPCVLLSQELEKVVEQLGDRVKVVKVDVDENPDLSSSLRIEGLPTIVFIPKENGKPALRTEGLLPAQQIMDIIADVESGSVKASG